MAGKSKGCREPQSHRCPSDEFWRKGDVVMWDNRATMHRGRPWPAHEARLVIPGPRIMTFFYEGAARPR